MARDWELLLEAAPGCVVPQDCFATVRPHDAKTSSPPQQCFPNEESRLGPVKGGGPVIVDIFQRVGTVSLSFVEPGASREVELNWPGVTGVRFHITVVPPEPLAQDVIDAIKVDAAQDEHPCSAGLSRAPSPAPPLAGLTDEEAAWAGAKGLAPSREFIERETLSGILDAELPAPEAVFHRQKSVDGGVASWNLPDEKPMYKPITLNNCDQIIPNLYLGGINAASNTQELVEQGIRAVCCCCRELEFPERDFEPQLKYFRVDVEDIGREPIELYFPEATEFIDSWVSRDQPVLVHCRAGVSRSASVVIAYLMTYHGYTLYDAFFLVRSHRSIITPNIGFMEKLGDYEEKLKGTEPSIEINKYIGWYSTPERAAVPDLMPD